MKKALINILTVLSVLVFVWLGASWIDTNLHNSPTSDSYQDFAKWNAFSIMFDWE